MSTKPKPESTFPDAWLENAKNLEQTTNSFVVIIRMVPIKLGDNRMVWRGSVQHVQSRAKIYFGELSLLTDFVCLRSGIYSSDPPWRSRLVQVCKIHVMKNLFRLLGKS